MLAASTSTPNTQQSVKSTPIPSNWLGVTEGVRVAKEAIAAHRYEQAEQILSEVLTFAPSETTGWKLLTRVQRELGRTEAGISSAKKALQLQSASITAKSESPASITLAKLLWQQGEKAQAYQMLDLLMIRQPENQVFITLKNKWSQEPSL